MSCRRRSVSYPNLRSRRIAVTVKGVTKNFKLYFVRLELRCFSGVFETLAFSTLFYFENLGTVFLCV